MTKEVPSLPQLNNMVVLAKLGDSITTDHISPAGAIKKQSPAGGFLQSHDIAPADFNSYGSRRGNHEIMMRGTFANVRLRNMLAPETEGGYTTYLPTDEVLPIFDAAMRYQASKVPLMVLAGGEYGSGSSRDWAAKGPSLLGVKMVLAVSYERIHRSNLIGMGILPLQFKPGQSAETHQLTGTETYSVSKLSPGCTEVTVTVIDAGAVKELTALVRIDTPKEWDYYQHRGILNYMIRKLSA